MARKSSPPGTGRVTLDVDAEIAALKAANDKDLQAKAQLEAQIRGREENMTFLRGIRSRVTGDIVLDGLSDTGMTSEPTRRLEVGSSTLASASTFIEPKLTQKYMSLSAMDEASEGGLLAIEIINRASERFPYANRIERTSLSPLLAKMASPKNGPPLVIHHKTANRWSITSTGRDELKRLRGDQ